MTDLTNLRIFVCASPINRLKRWIYGRRSEKVSEAEGQQHLFDLESSAMICTMFGLSASSLANTGFVKQTIMRTATR
jgi:hypothetical protein